MKFCKVQTGCQLSSSFNLTLVTATSSMECRACQGKHQVDVFFHLFFPSFLILLTEGFCLMCFQQRLVTGFTEKSLLWTRKQFPYSCQGKGHTPNILNRDAGSCLRPWTYFCLCTEWKGLFLHRYTGTSLVFTGLHEDFIVRNLVLTPALSFQGHAEGGHRMREGNSLAQTESMAVGLQKSALHCAPQWECQLAQV